MNWKQLDKTNANLYKGIAILMIVTHNFMHLFPLPGQNEFRFSSESFYKLLDLLWHEPENSIQVTLSFFGHFGVQVFIFLSAYGLTKKYLSHQTKYWSFIWDRIVKIYPSFILAILFWALISGWLYYGLLGPLKVVYWSYEGLILKLTLLSNFIPGKSLFPVGPWWFIPFIFQFYFIFPLLLKLYSRWGEKGLIAISVISITFAMMVNGKIGDLDIYFTILGHLPEFCLGIYLAKNDDAGLRFPAGLFFLALIIFFLGNIYEIFWYLSHLSFLILLLAAFNFLMPKINAGNVSKEVLLFFGSISMPLFLVNGFLRQPFITWAKDYDYWLLTIALCLVSLIVSVVVALVLSKSERYLMSKVIC